MGIRQHLLTAMPHIYLITMTTDEVIVRKAYVFLNIFQANNSKAPGRMQWSAAHHDRMEALNANLGDLNTKLLAALGQGQMETLVGMHQSTNYQILVMNNKLEQVAQIIQSQMLTSSRQRNPSPDVKGSKHDEPDQAPILFGFPRYPDKAVSANFTDIASESLGFDSSEALGSESSKSHAIHRYLH